MSCCSCIYDAVAIGHVSCAAEFIDSGIVDFDERYGGSLTTILMQAAINGRNDILKRLIEAGAPLETKDGFIGRSTLVYATRGSNECIRTLVNAGCLVDAKDNQGNTALMIAVYSDNRCIISTLVVMGASVYAQTNKGATVLSAALSWERIECYNLMIDALRVLTLTELISKVGNKTLIPLPVVGGHIALYDIIAEYAC